MMPGKPDTGDLNAFYILFALGILGGFFGLGVLSMAAFGVLLLLLWKSPMHTDLLIAAHNRWLHNSVLIGLAVYGVFYGALVMEIVFSIGDPAESANLITVLVSHWVLGMVVGFVVSVFLTFRLIKGVSRLRDGKTP